jgi:hypothetical protein
MPFLTYNDIARMTKNMASKQISAESWSDEAIEFVRLEEACCYLLNQWLTEWNRFESIVGIGFAVCGANLLRFFDIAQELMEAGLWNIGSEADFGGGDTGGAGATEEVPEDETEDERPWWIPGSGQGGPLGP